MAHYGQMDDFEAMMIDYQPSELINPQQLFNDDRMPVADISMPSAIEVMQGVDDQAEEVVTKQSTNDQLANEMAAVSQEAQVNANVALGDDAAHYLHLYVEAKNMLDQREKVLEQQLKDLNKAHGDLDAKKIEFQRLQKEIASVKVEITGLIKIAADREIHINTLQVSLNEAREALAVERDLTKTHNVDQHCRKLKALHDATVKAHDEEIQKFRNQIAQREKIQTQMVGEMTIKHCDAMMNVENQLRQLTAEYEADKQRFIDEKQRCIDRHDEAVGKLQLDLEEAIMERDACLQDRQQALQAHDAVTTDRELAVSHYHLLARERDDAVKQRDQVVADHASVNGELESIRQAMKGANELIAGLKLKVNQLEGNSPLHEVPIPVTRFKTAPAVSDEIILNKWKHLYAEITFLAAELTGCPTVCPNTGYQLHPHVVELLSTIVPARTKRRWEDYMASDDHRKYLVEALIWEMIVKYLENNCVWYGMIGAQFKALLTSLRTGIVQTGTNADALKQYSITRAEQALVIQQFDGAAHDLAARNALVANVADQLIPFYPTTATTIQDQPLASSIGESINKIFWIAHELDCIFMLSLAHWKPLNGRRQRGWTPRMHQTPIWIADEDLNGKECPIAFEVAPCLRRTGTNDGEHFDQSEYLVKGTVIPFFKP